jgi:ADP-dependent glucokinase
LEGQPNEYRQQRLKEVANELTSSTMSTTSPIHIELASVGEILYMKQLAYLIIPTVNSLGLNEQELGSLYLALGGTEFDRENFKDPLVSTVVSALQFVYREIEKIPTFSRKLTRIHFHCLTFHMIIQVKNSNWNNAKEVP